MLAPMVTGRPFSMQLNNKKITSNDLSILVHKDGFSFCTHEQHHFLGFEVAPPTTDSIKSFADYHQLTQKNVQLIYMDEPSVSVPLQLFDENHKEDYLKTAIDKNEKRIAQKNELTQLDQVVVYSIDTAIGKSLTDIYPSATTVHLSTALLRPLSAFSFGKARKNMFIHLRKGRFDLFLFQGGQLLLQNTFSHSNADEFMYFLFYVCEQFYLKPEQFDLFFLGKYTQYDDYYNGTKEFHPTIEHLAAVFFNEDTSHPAPFMQSFLLE